MKKFFLFVILSLGLTSISYGDKSDGFFDNWSNDHLCGWMDKPSPPAYMVVEVNKRGIIVKTGEDSVRLINIEPAIEIQLGSYL